MPDNPTTQPFDPASTTRPIGALLTYYTIVSLFTVILFPIVFPPLYFKYRSLRYKFDDQGVSMSWGVLFKREVYLTYRRIQDIHVSRGIIQRWLGLATVSVQTASGSAGAEMSIEGIENPEALRDYLYSRMRGSKDTTKPGTAEPHENQPAADHAGSTSNDEALTLLTEILGHVKALREERDAGEANDDRA